MPENRRTPPEFETDVLVAGAGPAGLATAITALCHGARVLVVERRGGTSTVPRATGVSVRTMELFRTWGIASEVRSRSVACEPAYAVRRTLSDPPLPRSPSAIPASASWWRRARSSRCCALRTSSSPCSPIRCVPSAARSASTPP